MEGGIQVESVAAGGDRHQQHQSAMNGSRIGGFRFELEDAARGGGGGGGRIQAPSPSAVADIVGQVRALLSQMDLAEFGPFEGNISGLDEMRLGIPRDVHSAQHDERRSSGVSFPKYERLDAAAAAMRVSFLCVCSLALLQCVCCDLLNSVSILGFSSFVT